MSERKISEKEFWEAKGLKYYDNAWEAVGISNRAVPFTETRLYKETRANHSRYKRRKQ